jgi:hypothetical protein
VDIINLSLEVSCLIRPLQYDISFGSSNAHLSLSVNSQTQQLGCEIYIPDSKPLFNLFHKYKSEIETELGLKLNWEELPQKKASRIKLIKEGDFTNQDNWNEYHEWLLESALNFQKVFGKINKQYPLSI